VTSIVSAYGEWLAKSNVPKLFVKAEPGVLVAGGANLDTVRSWPAQTEVTGPGIHFVQEESPDEIGRAIAGWMRTLGDGGHAIAAGGGCADQAYRQRRSRSRSLSLR